MRPALASLPEPDDGWLRRASIRSYAVLRERDPVRQQELIAADMLELLAADAVQLFKLDANGSNSDGERYGRPLPEVAEQMQTALLPAALAASRSLISNHPALDPQLADLALRCRDARVTTHLLLVRAHGETHGAYAVHWLGRERPSFEVRSGFYHYWDTIGIAIAATRELPQLQAETAQLREYAFFDPLTGLPNGRALDEELAANTDVQPFSVLALDFDGMREANHVFGYSAGGDVLIRAVARGLQELALPGEFAARMHNAGDEFALLLPGVDDQSAAARAARGRSRARRARRAGDAPRSLPRRLRRPCQPPPAGDARPGARPGDRADARTKTRA